MNQNTEEKEVKSSSARKAQLRGLVIAMCAFAACVALSACGSSSSSTSGGTAASTTAESAEPSATKSDEGGSAGAEEASDQEPVEIAYFEQIENDFTEPQLEGVEAAAEKFNAKVTVFDGKSEPTVQVNQMGDALSSGKEWGAWIVGALEGASVAPSVESAAEADIPVVCAVATCGPNSISTKPQSQSVSFVGPDAKHLGVLMGELAVEACGKASPCQVFLMTGIPTFSVDIATAKAMEETIAETPGVEIEQSQKGGNFEPEAARVVTQDYLQGHPDVNVIATTGDQMTQGVQVAVEEAGKEGEIALIGVGASRQAVSAVKAGEWYGSIVRVPYDEGYKSAELAIKAARGEEVEPTVTVGELSKVEVVTKETAGEFEGQWNS